MNMITLYLNNFRGFNNTFIDIQKINFLVGENSTGKTSVLKILKLIYDDNFWNKDDLDISSAGLGYFHEITSDDENNSSFFEIGYYDDIIQQGLKIKYTSKAEKPTVSEISFLRKHFDMQCIIQSDKNIKYRYIKRTDSSIDLRKYFETWVKGSTVSSVHFNELNSTKYNRFPLIFRISISLLDLDLEDENIDVVESLFANFKSFAPIRSNPKRVYGENTFAPNPDGSHTPYLLRERLIEESGSLNNQENVRKITQILNRFGLDSGLFDSISIKNYGHGFASPFQLLISINGREHNFTNVGYGVSQILPILIEIIISKKDSVFAIQQPEVHLHPKGQAAFGDFIYKSCIEENKNFVIETHSDYLIDRFRIRLSKSTENESDLSTQILFFSKDSSGNKVTQIKIESDGKFGSDIPKKYRDFFIKEQLNLLDI